MIWADLLFLYVLLRYHIIGSLLSSVVSVTGLLRIFVWMIHKGNFMTKKRFFLITGVYSSLELLSLAPANAKLDLIELWDVMTGASLPSAKFCCLLSFLELRMPRVLALSASGASASSA